MRQFSQMRLTELRTFMVNTLSCGQTKLYYRIFWAILQEEILKFSIEGNCGPNMAVKSTYLRRARDGSGDAGRETLDEVVIVFPSALRDNYASGIFAREAAGGGFGAGAEAAAAHLKPLAGHAPFRQKRAASITPKGTPLRRIPPYFGKGLSPHVSNRVVSGELIRIYRTIPRYARYPGSA